MKYRTRTGKELGDAYLFSDVSKGLYAASSSKAPVTTKLFSGIIGYFIGGTAFITKSFLRKNLGERTFGVFTLLFVYVWVLAVYLYPIAYKSVLGLFNSGDGGHSLGAKILSFFGALISLPFKFFSSEKQGEMNFNPELPTSLNLLVGLTLIIGIAHLADIYSRRLRKKVVHSFYRGDSVFFGWLLGKQVRNFTITTTVIWMVIEPLSILVLAFLIGQYLGKIDVAYVLVVSAICLFLEEYKVYKENKRFILDMLDGRLDAAYMSSVQEEYREGLSSEKENSANSYVASVSGMREKQRESKGSSSKFRAKVY